MKDMDDAKYDMGYHITRVRKARELKLDQHLYVKSKVEKFGIKKASRILASSGVSFISKADEPQTPEKKEKRCQSSHTKKQWGRSCGRQQ